MAEPTFSVEDWCKIYEIHCVGREVHWDPGKVHCLGKEAHCIWKDRGSGNRVT